MKTTRAPAGLVEAVSAHLQRVEPDGIYWPLDVAVPNEYDAPYIARAAWDAVAAHLELTDDA